MTEQQPYEVIRREAGFELRRYPEHLVAEVTVSARFEDAGNRAFRYLFSYINGANRSRAQVAMTAPVVQTPSTASSTTPSSKIAMTAPVVQQSGDGADEYRIAFVLPASLTLETAPQPTDPAVRLRAVPDSTAAVIRFNGRWTERAYQKHLAELRRALEGASLVPRGVPRYARFDPPYLPAFLRRNEVLLDIEE